MHYLIDGHNLIGQIPDIDLADPDDEMKLVMRLRRWTVADPHRVATVIFDGGLFHGKSASLSGTLLTVIFSSHKQTADALLIKRLRALRNQQEFTLVSSDRAIIKEARRRRVPVIRSNQFAADLASEATARAAPTPPPPPPSPKEEPQLSEAEVAAWLAEFGPVNVPASRPYRRKQPPVAAEAAAPAAAPRPAADLKESGSALTQAEIDEWLALFGEPQAVADDKAPPAERLVPGRKTAPQGDGGRAADQRKGSNARISSEEIDEWLDLFGRDTS